MYRMTTRLTADESALPTGWKEPGIGLSCSQNKETLSYIYLNRKNVKQGGAMAHLVLLPLSYIRIGDGWYAE
jgi:hypothetical protein